jgi:hypothetical protein
LTSTDIFVARELSVASGNHNPATQSPQSRPNCNHHWRATRITGMGMTELQERLALEREEIVKRVATFKATQEKFKREREEYCVTTLQNAAADPDGCRSGRKASFNAS